MIKVSNLSYEYPGNRALNSISFTAKIGTIIAIVGPNGAGKTTLFKCITTLLKPMSGTITINGMSVVNNPLGCKAVLGYLADDYGLYDQLTVAQVLSYFAQAHGVAKNEIATRVSETVDLLNLRNKLNEPCGSLSRGMRQRVAIGQAMIHKPKLLVLDEPASGLDPEARHDLAQLFLSLKKEGVTLLVSSHILAELDEYADDLIVLRGGAIVSDDINEIEEEGEQRKIIVTISEGLDGVLSLLSTNTYVPQAHDGDVLSALSKVSDVTSQDSEVRFLFSGTKEQQHLVMKFLVNEGCMIEEFYQETLNLQEKYLTMVKEHESK